jgi:hypothetical protein
MKKTVLQQAITKYREAIEELKQFNTQHAESKIVALESAVEVLTDLLPKEREDLEEAFNNGWERGRVGLPSTSNEYMNRTFEQ